MTINHYTYIVRYDRRRTSPSRIVTALELIFKRLEDLRLEELESQGVTITTAILANPDLVVMSEVGDTPIIDVDDNLSIFKLEVTAIFNPNGIYGLQNEETIFKRIAIIVDILNQKNIETQPNINVTYDQLHEPYVFFNSVLAVRIEPYQSFNDNIERLWDELVASDEHGSLNMSSHLAVSGNPSPTERPSNPNPAVAMAGPMIHNPSSGPGDANPAVGPYHIGGKRKTRKTKGRRSKKYRKSTCKRRRKIREMTFKSP